MMEKKHYGALLLVVWLVLVVALMDKLSPIDAFMNVVPSTSTRRYKINVTKLQELSLSSSSSSSPSMEKEKENEEKQQQQEERQRRAPPRSGILQSILNIMLDSPIWKYVLVPQARKKMVDTASENNIPWKSCYEWLESQPNSPWKKNNKNNLDISHVPEYYKQSFHAYEDGNLCWDAAIEAEIASKAVGARNFPQYGSTGEIAFRTAFDLGIKQGGGTCPKDGIIVDLGCGTGISTRRLAKTFPQASKIVGIDMSPYYIEVGTYLLNECNTTPIKSIEDGGPWANTIDYDPRIEYQVGDAAKMTTIPDNSIDVVNLQFVAHELPHVVTLDVINEAYRILKPKGGQLHFSEMDFETPGYSSQRSNALLFSLIRATEPYLDDYADHHVEVRTKLQELFTTTIITPATGRHFAIVATKKNKKNCCNNNEDNINNQQQQAQAPHNHILEDNRFNPITGEYLVEDTHLMTFDNKL